MLEVVFYESNQDLLGKMQAGNTPLVICPSPLIADNLRNLAPALEVITISKWTADHLKTLGLTRSRKSELMVKLAAVWRHYYPNEKTSVYLEAFELFTELRSFTLNLDLLAEFFKELDDVIVKSIFIFWAYLDQEKIIDEHSSYKKVTESRSHRPMWFIGFKHLSGVQIDMLKVLSEDHEVELFFPASVYVDALPNDWIKWLASEGPLRAESVKTEARVSVLPKGKANVILDKFFETHPHYDLLMAGTRVGLVSFQEAQRKKSFFKTTEDLFGTETEWLMSSLRQKLKEEKGLNLETTSVFLDELKKESEEKGEYRKYKVIELFNEAMKSYGEFQAGIDSFALDILEVITGLNSPRVSLITLEDNIERHFLDMNALNFRNDEKPLALLATGSLGGFRSNEKILSEAMTKALRAIGPIKRAGLEFLFHKYELLSVLNHPETVLLVEEQVLETDLSWREILKHFDVVDFDLDVKYTIKKVHEYLLPKMKEGPFAQKSFSASKLQTFIDCPQKFYFTHIEKIDNRPMERASLGPDELGNLEHKIIAKYFEESKSITAEIDLSMHQKICVQVFNEYLNESKLVLNETEKARSYNEIMHYTWNGVVFLIDLIKAKNATAIKFEVPLGQNPWNLNGSIDCLLIQGDKKVSILDFKRSSSATGTKTETVEFKKIQLWVYLLVLKHQNFEIDAFGYLNLSDLADDKLFFDGDEAQKLLSSSIDSAEGVVKTAIEDILAMRTFRANPRENKVCHFCPVNLFCLKGGPCEP